jgi:hypothetical protein
MSLDRFDELVDQWTLLEGERKLLANKTGATRLGFAMLVKFFKLHGRFPAAAPMRHFEDPRPRASGTRLPRTAPGPICWEFTLPSWGTA